MKKWWESRTIWAGLVTIALGTAGLLDVVPDVLNEALAIAQIVTGMLTIYFRKTTKVGVGAVFADNRITGTRIPMDRS